MVAAKALLHESISHKNFKIKYEHSKGQPGVLLRQPKLQDFILILNYYNKTNNWNNFSRRHCFVPTNFSFF